MCYALERYALETDARVENSPAHQHKSANYPSSSSSQEDELSDASTVENASRGNETEVSSEDKILHFIDQNVIGSNCVIETPFGHRCVTYADYTASGRALKYLEDRITKQFLPRYANTHCSVCCWKVLN